MLTASGRFAVAVLEDLAGTTLLEPPDHAAELAWGIGHRTADTPGEVEVKSEGLTAVEAGGCQCLRVVADSVGFGCDDNGVYVSFEDTVQGVSTRPGYQLHPGTAAASTTPPVAPRLSAESRSPELKSQCRFRPPTPLPSRFTDWHGVTVWCGRGDLTTRIPGAPRWLGRDIGLPVRSPM